MVTTGMIGQLGYLPSMSGKFQQDQSGRALGSCQDQNQQSTLTDQMGVDRCSVCNAVHGNKLINCCFFGAAKLPVMDVLNITKEVMV